jgi:hypothetical protein
LKFYAALRARDVVERNEKAARQPDGLFFKGE